MTKEDKIKKLIEHELIWLHENFNAENLAETTKFFAKGGFDVWTNLRVDIKYDDLFGDN